MSNFLILKIFRHRWPVLAALGTTAAIFLWPAIPLRGLDDWFRVYLSSSYLTYLYPTIALLSGTVVGTYTYHKTVQPCCPVGSVKTGATGSFVGVFFGACPACIPAIAVFLPLSANVFLSRVAPIFSLVSIALLIFAIYRMNGFRKVV
ncbi:MAG: hypothetical protein HY567_02100 [Candidatus Kerfeldbacteria bacterium]|nr:hypothetical protein [Candidatus Kerfeldbacteria bacterium]